MTAPLLLSRARLRSARGEVLSAIAPILLGKNPGAQAGHAHRIVWLLFQDIQDATRDFLWRDEGDGKYLILSRREPADPQNLFELETKPFVPDLRAGDRLRFALRANPTVATKRAGSKPSANGRERGTRVDVVMDALYQVPKGERARLRDEITADATARWLASQGDKFGFKPAGPVVVGSNDRIDIERRRGRAAGISVFDLEGIIEVTDPAALLAKLGQGFGSAKAFGNGLMLIRRA